MSLEDLHETAQANTPSTVNVPQTWGGLIVWAVGKWGVGVVFLMLLVPVYQDLKASNQQLADISKANVSILTSLAQQVEATNKTVERLDQTVQRLELESRASARPQ